MVDMVRIAHSRINRFAAMTCFSSRREWSPLSASEICPRVTSFLSLDNLCIFRALEWREIIHAHTCQAFSLSWHSELLSIPSFDTVGREVPVHFNFRPGRNEC